MAGTAQSVLLPSAVSTSTVASASVGGRDLVEGVCEPTLHNVYLLIQQCSTSLTLLTGQVQAMREDVTLIRHDFQKLREHTTALETQVSDIEDTVSRLVAEVKVAINKINVNITKMEDL